MKFRSSRGIRFHSSRFDFRSFTTPTRRQPGAGYVLPTSRTNTRTLGRDGYSSRKAARGGFDRRAHRPPQGGLSFIERLTRVPWFAIAIIHNLEAGGDFNSHLHGAPPTARTVHAPAGRPRSGNPPFTWEESAVDALEYDGPHRVTDWSTEHLAYLFEGFNGWGYRLYHPHEVAVPVELQQSLYREICR